MSKMIHSSYSSWMEPFGGASTCSKKWEAVVIKLAGNLHNLDDNHGNVVL